MSIAAAVLAAGLGSRFAGDVAKPLALLNGRPLVAWALDAAIASGLMPTLLVVGSHAPEIAEAAPRGVQVVTAALSELGISHSLHAAVDALEGQGEVTATCIGLADQPRVGAEAFRRLAHAHADGADFAVATYAGERGNPVLLGRNVWAAARRLTGDVGARALMGEHEVVEIDCTDTGSPRDVDTLEDLRALEEEMGRP
ncbi:MAG: nucleotidyltransferase family protein [Acidimicrobiia bacterium]